MKIATKKIITLGLLALTCLLFSGQNSAAVTRSSHQDPIMYDTLQIPRPTIRGSVAYLCVDQKCSNMKPACDPPLADGEIDHTIIDADGVELDLSKTYTTQGRCAGGLESAADPTGAATTVGAMANFGAKAGSAVANNGGNGGNYIYNNIHATENMVRPANEGDSFWDILGDSLLDALPGIIQGSDQNSDLQESPACEGLDVEYDGGLSEGEYLRLREQLATLLNELGSIDIRGDVVSSLQVENACDVQTNVSSLNNGGLIYQSCGGESSLYATSPSLLGDLYSGDYSAIRDLPQAAQDFIVEAIVPRNFASVISEPTTQLQGNILQLPEQNGGFRTINCSSASFGQNNQIFDQRFIEKYQAMLGTGVDLQIEQFMEDFRSDLTGATYNLGVPILNADMLTCLSSQQVTNPSTLVDISAFEVAMTLDGNMPGINYLDAIDFSRNLNSSLRTDGIINLLAGQGTQQISNIIRQLEQGQNTADIARGLPDDLAEMLLSGDVSLNDLRAIAALDGNSMALLLNSENAESTVASLGDFTFGDKVEIDRSTLTENELRIVELLDEITSITGFNSEVLDVFLNERACSLQYGGTGEFFSTPGAGTNNNNLFEGGDAGDRFVDWLIGDGLALLTGFISDRYEPEPKGFTENGYQQRVRLPAIAPEVGGYPVEIELFGKSTTNFLEDYHDTVIATAQFVHHLSSAVSLSGRRPKVMLKNFSIVDPNILAKFQKRAFDGEYVGNLDKVKQELTEVAYNMCAPIDIHSDFNSNNRPYAKYTYLNFARVPDIQRIYNPDHPFSPRHIAADWKSEFEAKMGLYEFTINYTVKGRQAGELGCADYIYRGQSYSRRAPYSRWVHEDFAGEPDGNPVFDKRILKEPNGKTRFFADGSFLNGSTSSNREANDYSHWGTAHYLGGKIMATNARNTRFKKQYDQIYWPSFETCLPACIAACGDSIPCKNKCPRKCDRKSDAKARPKACRKHILQDVVPDNILAFHTAQAAGAHSTGAALKAYNRTPKSSVGGQPGYINAYGNAPVGSANWDNKPLTWFDSQPHNMFGYNMPFLRHFPSSKSCPGDTCPQLTSMSRDEFNKTKGVEGRYMEPWNMAVVANSGLSRWESGAQDVADRSCAFGGWNELMLLQSRTANWFGVNCLPGGGYWKTFYHGTAEAFALKSAGAKQDVGFDRWRSFDDINDVYGKRISSPFRDPSKSTFIEWPMNIPAECNGDYCIPGIVHNEWPKYNGTGDAFVKNGLDNAVANIEKYCQIDGEFYEDCVDPRAQTIIVFDPFERQTKNGANTRLPFTGVVVGLEDNQRCLIVETMNHGKQPDSCLNTHLWGRKSRMSLCKPNSGASVLKNMPCNNSDIKKCYEMDWDAFYVWNFMEDTRHISTTGADISAQCEAKISEIDNLLLAAKANKEIWDAVAGDFSGPNTGNAVKAIAQAKSMGCNPPIKMKSTGIFRGNSEISDIKLDSFAAFGWMPSKDVVSNTTNRPDLESDNARVIDAASKSAITAGEDDICFLQGGGGCANNSVYTMKADPGGEPALVLPTELVTEDIYEVDIPVTTVVSDLDFDPLGCYPVEETGVEDDGYDDIKPAYPATAYNESGGDAGLCQKKEGDPSGLRCGLYGMSDFGNSFGSSMRQFASRVEVTGGMVDGEFDFGECWGLKEVVNGEQDPSLLAWPDQIDGYASCGAADPTIAGSSSGGQATVTLTGENEGLTTRECLIKNKFRYCSDINPVGFMLEQEAYFTTDSEFSECAAKIRDAGGFTSDSCKPADDLGFGYCVMMPAVAQGPGILGLLTPGLSCEDIVDNITDGAINWLENTAQDFVNRTEWLSRFHKDKECMLPAAREAQDGSLTVQQGDAP